MAYSFGNNGLIIIHNTIRYCGEIIPNPPKFNNNKHNVTQINDKLYVNGWEYDLQNKKMEKVFKGFMAFDVLRKDLYERLYL